MGTTTNGLPWPNGTDFVVDGDDAIRALAEKIDALTLPFGYARARAIQASSHGAGSWNAMFLDVFADQHGHQPWTIDGATRRVTITKSGVYALTGVVTMAGGSSAVAVAISTDGTTWDRVASAPIGTVNYTNSTSTIRHLAAGTYVGLQMYASSVLNNVVDQVGSPTYLAIQALGGTAGIVP